MYVLFLAVNGVTEGFTFAVMSQEHVDRSVLAQCHFVYWLFLFCRHNYLLTISSLLYLLASYMLTGLCGSAGLILANCVNMAVRIVCSCKFIRDFFSTTSYHPLRHSIPSLKLLLTFVIALLVTALSEVEKVLWFCKVLNVFINRCIFAVDMAGCGD